MDSLIQWLSSGNRMLYIVLIIGTVFTFFWLMSFKDRLRLNTIKALVASIVHTLFGVLTVKVFAVAETANIDNLGNMSIFGATFFMPILYFAFAKLGKRNTADVFDIGTVCMMFTLMCSRFNCLISGCCKGILFFNSDSFRWPTRELEILFYVVLIIILGINVNKEKSRGTNYPIYMIAYGVFRFVIEWVRVYDTPSFIHRAHIWAIISLFLGVSVLAEIKSKRKNKEMKK